MKKKKFEKFDEKVIKSFRKNQEWIARIALFIIFFWFGILKVFMLSPAGPLVESLLEVTFLSGIPAQTFLIGFGLFEMALGIITIIPRLERITFLLMVLHLATTVMPLFLLPEIAWNGLAVPTLVGQYIIKNAALLALGISIFSHLKPMTKTHSVWGESKL